MKFNRELWHKLLDQAIDKCEEKQQSGVAYWLRELAEEQKAYETGINLSASACTVEWGPFTLKELTDKHGFGIIVESGPGSRKFKVDKVIGDEYVLFPHPYNSDLDAMIVVDRCGWKLVEIPKQATWQEMISELRETVKQANVYTLEELVEKYGSDIEVQDTTFNSNNVWRIVAISYQDMATLVNESNLTKVKVSKYLRSWTLVQETESFCQITEVPLWPVE